MPGNTKYASVGQPASATRCKIVAINDSTGFGLPANQSGELWVKGPQNMLGMDEKFVLVTFTPEC